MLGRVLFSQATCVQLVTILCISLFAHSESKRTEPLVLQAPFTDREESIKFGQSSCISWSGRYVAIGANGFQHFRGAIYVHELVAKNGRRSERWEQKRVVAKDAESAEERTSELRPQNRGSGFGFSCAFASLAGAHSSDDDDGDGDGDGDDDGDVYGRVSQSKNRRNRTVSIPDAVPRLIVGAPGKDVQRGSVYIFARTADGEWREINKLVSNDRRGGDTFGWDVAVDARCTVIAVGARGRRANNGEVVIFHCAVGCNMCAISHHIYPPDYSDSPGPHGIRIRNNFGMSVSLSANGDTLAVGCTGFEEERGAVYIYSRVRQVYDNNDGDDNNKNATNGDDNKVAGGGNSDSDNNDDAERNNATMNTDRGKAKNNENTNDNKDKFMWKMTQRLESPKAQKHGFFGFKVDMDAQGDTLVIGADGEDEYRGAAFIYERLMDNDKNQTNGVSYKLVAEIRSEERDREDNFGGSVSIAANGKVIAIGAPGAKHGHLNDHGVVHFYERTSKRWKPTTWEHSDSMWLTSHSSHNMLFAWAVSMSGDGRTLVATGPDWSHSLGLAAIKKFEAKGKQTWDWYQVETSPKNNNEEKEEL